MTYSAKSIVQKIKDLEEENQKKRAHELAIKAEDTKRAQDQLKKDSVFFLSIGKNIIEAALDGKSYCLIESENLTKFRTQILQCGLALNELKLTSAELKKDYPDLFAYLKLSDQLDEIEKEHENSMQSESAFWDVELSLLNDSLYDLLEHALEDYWYAHRIEKSIVDDITETSFSNSNSYEDDNSLLVGITELLSVLKKYEYQEFEDDDNFGESNVTSNLQEILLQIEDIEAAIKTNEDVVSVRRQNSLYKKDQIQAFYDRYQLITLIDWSQETSRHLIPRYSFLSPDSLNWLSDNPLMKDFFQLIEDCIINKKDSCEFVFHEYGKSHDQSEILENGLFFNDFLIEISINELQNVFASLEYSVKLIDMEPIDGDPSNLINKYILSISWSQGN